MPRFVGGPGAKGAALQASETVFRRGPGQIVCAVQKAQPSICRGNRNPPGPELASEAAERGNYSEAKPKRRQAERQTSLQEE